MLKGPKRIGNQLNIFVSTTDDDDNDNDDDDDNKNLHLCCLCSRSGFELKSGFLNPSTVNIWGQITVVGVVLCIIGYVAASLASTHYLTVTNQVCRPKMSLDIAICLPGKTNFFIIEEFLY